MSRPDPSRPVSNLSSALASIHINNHHPNEYINTYSNSNHVSSDDTIDRIAEYRNHPPTEGISLFSHRVSIKQVFERYRFVLEQTTVLS